MDAKIRRSMSRKENDISSEKEMAKLIAQIDKGRKTPIIKDNVRQAIITVDQRVTFECFPAIPHDGVCLGGAPKPNTLGKESGIKDTRMIIFIDKSKILGRAVGYRASRKRRLVQGAERFGISVAKALRVRQIARVRQVLPTHGTR